MLVAHLTLLAIWFWLWLVLFGWGTLACGLARCDRRDSLAPIVNPWIGVGVVVGLLQIWHFAWPIGLWAFLVVSTVGVGGAILAGRRHLGALPANVRANLRLWVVGSLIVIWLVNRSLSSQLDHDHGMYYLNAIRWNTDYAIVPGLANLHVRFGFNNSNFLLHALLELGSWRGYTGHLVNGLLAAMTVPIVLPGIRDILDRPGRGGQLGWFTVGLGMMVAVCVVDRRVSTANPDFPAGLLATVAAWRLLAIALVPNESTDRLLRWNLLAIAVLATTALAIKTTVVFFVGLAALAVVLAMYLMQRERTGHPLWATLKLLAFMAPWALAIFGPWVARGYLLSGYPLFPATIAGAPVDWAYPPALAEQLRRDIYAFGRTQFEFFELGYEPISVWAGPWLVHSMLLRAPFEVVLPGVLSVVSLAWIAWSRRGSSLDDRGRDVGKLIVWVLAGCYVASLIAWFLTTPAARMANFAWWGLAGTMLGLASRMISADVVTAHRRAILVGLVVLFLLPMVEKSAVIEIRYRVTPTRPEYGKHCYAYLPLVIPESASGYSPLPVGKIEKRTNDLGLTVYVGQPTADGWPSLPWDSPLPAGRYYNPQLKLREAGNVQRGFMMVEPKTGGLGPPGKP